MEHLVTLASTEAEDSPARGNNQPAPATVPGHLTLQRVLSVHHWTDSLFSLTATRDPSFRFDNGQFVMIGIEVAGKPLLRAYSMVSPNYEDTLEFLSIKVANGPLTSRLQHIQPDDALFVGRKPTGTLLLDNLLPGRHLYLLATGTGIAPFMSLIQDPDVYARFGRVVLVHTCRTAAELAYADRIMTELPAHDLVGEDARAKLVYHPTVTREPFRNQGRVTDLIRTGALFSDIGLPSFDPSTDRVMLCGSPDMLADTQNLLRERGFVEGSGPKPGDYVVEKAFVER